MNTPLSNNERRRLEVLWEYDILDTPPEQSLDDLTALACFICDAPIALISMVDEHRQWFKSRIGMDQTETARDISFCTHAIQQSKVMVVPDAWKDPRFLHNPLVVSRPKIRFYAGAPLVTPDGLALGTLCVIDHVPRDLSTKQIEALGTLARVVMSELHFRHQLRKFSGIPLRQKPQ
jgi:GAF domain-containing protein